jgi:zinc protease
VTGDFDAKQMQAWVDKYFGPVIKPSRPLPRVNVDEPAWSADRSVSAHGPKVPLPAVALTWLGPSRDSADAAALQVASALLSTGDSSRLQQSLVYRQRVAADARFRADLRVGPGLLVATAVAAGGKSLTDAQAALQAEIDRMSQQPVDADELAKAKTQLLTRALIGRETPLGLGSALGEAAVLEGDAAFVNRRLQQLQAVTSADVQRVMRKYVADTHHVTIEYTQEGAAQ